MPVQNISVFLERLKNIAPPHAAVRKAVVRAVKQKTGIPINKKDVSVQNSIVYINAKPLVKNEIFIHKTEILDELKKELKKKTPKNIL